MKHHSLVLQLPRVHLDGVFSSALMATHTQVITIRGHVSSICTRIGQFHLHNARLRIVRFRAGKTRIFRTNFDFMWFFASSEGISTFV